jgi:GntR family transcriptional regulator
MLLNLTDISSEPLQSQIVRQVRAKILAGELPAETSLPSIRQLAKDHHVSVITVQRAYESLLREHLIHSRRGKGFFVSDLHDDEKYGLARQRLVDTLEKPISDAVDEGMGANDVREIIEEIIRKLELE